MKGFIEVAKECGYEIDEVFVDIRKDVPQTKYIMEVKGDSYIGKDGLEHTVPEEFKGFWMMRYATDLRWTPLHEAIEDYEWVRCEQVEVVSYEWSKL